MYNGVLAILLGEAWLFQSIRVVTYAVVVFACFHLFVVLYEERTLESRFGAAYEGYRQQVPRWGFTIRPHQEEDREHHLN